MHGTMHAWPCCTNIWTVCKNIYLDFMFCHSTTKRIRLVSWSSLIYDYFLVDQFVDQVFLGEMRKA